MTCNKGVSHIMFYIVALTMFATLVHSNLMGIDFGSDSYKVVLAPGSGRKQMQLVFNDGSARKTSTVIGFRPNERLFDSDAISLSKFKPENVYYHLRELLGRKDAETAKERIKKYVDYAHKIYNPVTLDKKNNTVDYPYLAIQHDAKTSYAVHELVAMILAQAKIIAEKQDGGRIVDCAISVPVYFTEDERQSLIDAASLAGLNVLSLIDQGSAIAVQYAAEQTFEEGPDSKRLVVFVDFGESSLQLTMAQYTQTIDEKAKNKKDANSTLVQILGSSWDAQLGSRDFTAVLVDHFIDQLRGKIPDIDTKPRVRSKLRVALRKAREVLSANKEVPVNIPNLDGDFDFETVLTRQIFEELTQKLLARIAPVFDQLFKTTGKTKDHVYAFEMLGGTGRIPANVIMKYLNKEVLDRHMNGDESAVFGATFFGASLSGRYRASKIKLKDIVHRNVSGVITTSDAPQLEASSEEGNENEEANVEKTTTKNVTVVVRGSKIHLKKTYSFYTTEPFTLELRYVESEEDPLRIPDGQTSFIDLYSFEGIPLNGTDPSLSNSTEDGADEAKKTYEQDEKEEDSIPKKKKSSKKTPKPASKTYYNMTAVPKVFIKVELVDGAMISVSAYAEIYHSEQVTKRVKKNDTASNTEAEIKLDGEDDSENKEEEDEYEAKEEAEKKESEKSEDEKTAEEGEKKSEDDEKAEEKEKEEEYETITEWVSKKEDVALKVKRKWGPLKSLLKRKAKETIAEVDRAERQRVKLQEARNELEAKVYSVKNGLEEEEIKSVTTEEQREELATLVSELADWVEYESQSADLLEIREKKNSLDKLVKPIFFRISEKEALPRELNSCLSMILAAQNVTSNITQTHEVKESDMENLNELIGNVTEFIESKKKEQDALQPSDEPILTSEALKKECDRVVAKVGQLLKKPKKRPPKVKETKKEETEKEGKEGTEQTEGEQKQEETKSESEQKEQKTEQTEQEGEKTEKPDL